MSLTNVLTGQPIANKQLKSISTLAKNLIDLDTQIGVAQTTLESLQDKRRQLAEELLPGAMTEVGLSDFTLTTGQQIIVAKFYSCGLPKADEDPLLRTRAFNWLRDNGHGGLIKTNIISQFGKGEEAEVRRATLALTKARVPFFQKDDVHYQTLKAWVRETYEAGHEVPTDLFRVFIGNRATIK